MKIPVKPLLLILPLLLWLGYITFMSIGRSYLAETIIEDSPVTWSSGDKRLTAILTKTLDGEAHHHRILITDRQGKAVLEQKTTFVWDLGTAGMAAALQMDEDAELEIAVVDINLKSKENYYLDHAEGKVRQIPFSHAGHRAVEQIERWFAFNAPNPFQLGFYLLLTLLYYLLFFPIQWLIKRLFLRHRAKE